MRRSSTVMSFIAAAVTLLAASAAQAATCTADIEGNDAMQFNKTSLDVSKTCPQFTVTLKHAGKLPKAAMGHNWVLAKTSDVQGITADGAAAGLDKQYLKPGDSRVLASSKVIGPGESDSVSVPVAKLQAGESYTYFCSFPGHSSIMKGTLKLVN